MLWCPASAITCEGSEIMEPIHRATGPLPFDPRCQPAQLCMRSVARRCLPQYGVCVLSHACAHKNSNAATFGRLYRLTIHDDDGGTNGSSGLPSYLLVH